jgi:hypothetical protein
MSAYMIDPPCLIDCQHTMRLFQEIFAGSQNGFVSGENGFVRSVPMKPVHGIEIRPGFCYARARAYWSRNCAAGVFTVAVVSLFENSHVVDLARLSDFNPPRV